MRTRLFQIASLALVFCALASGNVAVAALSGSIALERAAPARAPAVRLAAGPVLCVGGRLVGDRCLCPPGTVNLSGHCVPPPPPPKIEKMSPSLKPAQPTAPMKPRPLCTGGKVLMGGNCVCPQGTVELSGRCVPRLTR